MFTTTQTSTNTSIRPVIRFDTEYLKTIHGMLKVVLLVLGIINVITINVSAENRGATSFFNTSLALGWWFTLIMLILFLFHIPEKFYTLPWLPVEIGVLCIVTLMYFIASLMVILVSDVIHTVAGVFGFVTMGVYAYSGFLKFKSWKNGELAQGSLSRSTTTTTNVEASAYPA